MQTDTTAKGYALTPGHRTYIFVLLCLLYFFDGLDRYVVASVFPYIKNEFALTDMQSGMLVSTVYWSILILVIPASIIIDRWSRRKTISIMAIIWSIGSIACIAINNFAQLFTARTILGFGEAGYAAGGQAMITGMYPAEKRARMLGIFGASAFVANAVAAALGGFIAVRWGWRSVFGLTALPGLAVAIMFFFIKDYKTVELIKTVKEATTGIASKVKMKAGDAAKEFLRRPTLPLTYCGMGFVQFVAVAGITWLPTYFNRTAGLPMDQAGLRTASILLLTIVGAPLGGYLSDLWVKKKINSRLPFATVTTLVAALFSFLGFVIFQGTVQYICLLCLGLTMTLFTGAAVAVTQEVAHPGLRAISGGLSVVATSLIGGSFSPIVIGAISDSAGIQTAMKLLPAFLCLAAAFFLVGSFCFMRDYNRVEKIELKAES